MSINLEKTYNSLIKEISKESSVGDVRELLSGSPLVSINKRIVLLKLILALMKEQSLSTDTKELLILVGEMALCSYPEKLLS